MDMSKLGTNQKIGVSAGVLALISLFLPWYGVSFAGLGSVNANAFDAGFFAWFAMILAIAAAVILFLKAMDIADAKAGKLAAEQIALLLGGLAVIFVLLRLVTETSFLKWGLFVGLIAAAGVAYGAFGSMKDAGIAMPSVDDFKPDSEGSDDV